MENLRDQFAAQQQYSRPIWIKITGSSGVRYSWSQVDETDVAAFDTANLDSEFSLSGTTTATGWPAYEVNGSTSVPTGTKVLAYPSVSGDSWVFEYSAGSGVTVEEVDGSPSYASTTTLRFDQADGFVVSQPGAGIARVDQTAASATTVGYVNLSNQFLGQNQKGVEQFYIHPDPASGSVSPVYLATSGANGELQVWASDPGTLTPTPASADGGLYCSFVVTGGGTGVGTTPSDNGGYFGGKVRALGQIVCETFTAGYPAVSLQTAVSRSSIAGPGLYFLDTGTPSEIGFFLWDYDYTKSFVFYRGSTNYDARILLLGANYAINTGGGGGDQDGVTNTLYANPVATGGIITDRGAKLSAVTALTDSTGGTANDTLVAISGSGDDTNINNNFADIAAKINTLISRLQSANILT